MGADWSIWRPAVAALQKALVVDPEVKERVLLRGLQWYPPEHEDGGG